MDLENEYLSLLKMNGYTEALKLYEGMDAEKKQQTLQQYAAQKQANANNTSGNVFKNIALGLLTGGIFPAINAPIEYNQSQNNQINAGLVTEAMAKKQNEDPTPKAEPTETASNVANVLANQAGTSATQKAVNAGMSKARAGLMGSVGDNQQRATANLQNTLANQKQGAMNDLLSRQGDITKLNQEYQNTNIAEWLNTIGGLLTSDENEKVAPLTDDDLLKRVYHIFELKERLDSLKKER